MDCCKKYQDIRNIVLNAIKEDIGARDITTDYVLPGNKSVHAFIFVKEDCVICGVSIAKLAFQLKSRGIKFKALAKDGEFIKKGRIIAKIHGPAKAILKAERVALNFLSFLSGVSTVTKRFVNAAKPYGAKIIDTRKTIPGLRTLQKYAVRVGGGFNHRFSLDQMIMVKDNHLKILNSRGKIQNFDQMMKKLGKKMPQRMKIEIEVKNLREFRQVLKLSPDIIMLDNMSISDMRKAVQIRNKLFPKSSNYFPKLEASGGVNLKNVKKIASTGIDMISIGALTHSVNSVDISLEIKNPG